MDPEIRFILACTGISLVITYAWWTHWRVWIFRQDLFDIRDRVWDLMLEKGLLDHSDHREFRAMVNTLIGAAPMLSWVTIIVALILREDLRSSIVPEPVIPEIARAREDVFVRMAHYLIYGSILGWLILGVLRLLGLAAAFRRFLSLRLRWMVDARAFQGLASLALGGRKRRSLALWERW